MIFNINQQVASISNNDYSLFFAKPNVVGLGFGYKHTNNLNTFEPSIHVFVTTKVASNLLPNNALIPTVYKGIKTDVIETGLFKANDNLNTVNYSTSSQVASNISMANSFTKKIRPVQPGYSISLSLSNATTGTLGCIVTDKNQTNQSYCILSTNSTLADLNKAKLGTTVVQPAFQYGGNPSTDIIASLIKFYNIKFDNTIPPSINDFNTVDAAVAQFHNTNQDTINPTIPNIGIPTGTASPILSQGIQWTGSLSGTAKGTIFSTNATITVDYGNRGFAHFKDVVLSTGEAKPGDSGSLICNNSKKAISLIFGHYNTGVISCKINHVLELLNINLLTQ